MKQHYLVQKFPENPTQPILWVVYNEDMIPSAKKLIESIRGKEYLQKFVNVVSIDNQDKDRNCTVYLDPLLYNYLGNGND
jgi:hypothetical protein